MKSNVHNFVGEVVKAVIAGVLEANSKGVDCDLPSSISCKMNVAWTGEAIYTTTSEDAAMVVCFDVDMKSNGKPTTTHVGLAKG